MSLIFSTAESRREDDVDRTTMATARHGERVDSIGRYKMPLLPGESGPKSGGDWVPKGVQSATNLAGAIVESRELGIWERERCQLGLAMRPDLYERMSFAVRMAERRVFGQATPGDQRVSIVAPGVRLADVAPELKAELGLIHDEAKRHAGGDAASRQGTNRHDVWETRAKTSQLFGTPEINAQVEKLEALLAANHLARVPGLQERTVRNVALGAAGRFDDVLRDTRTGEMYMADLKTRRRKFYSMLEVRIQLAVYATAEWMLISATSAAQKMYEGSEWYVPGPKHHVSQQWGIVLRMPADGGEPELIRVNVEKGFAHAMLARQVVDARAEAKSVAAFGEAVWA